MASQISKGKLPSTTCNHNVCFLRCDYSFLTICFVLKKNSQVQNEKTKNVIAEISLRGTTIHIILPVYT